MTGRALRAIHARLLAADGVTLTEMLVVLAILTIVVGGLMTLMVSASNAQVDQQKRFEAQQEARLALDSLRREIHCANSLTGTPPTASITVGLGSYCPTSAGATNVTWCTQTIVASKRYALWRYPAASVPSCGVTTGGVKRADYLITGNVFNSFTPKNTPAGSYNLAKLGITLPVDVNADDAKQRYTLADDIVFRNSGRS